MYIYHYDEKTKEYLDKTVAEQDPAQSAIQNTFVPLIPANSTLIEPPAVEEGQAAVFNGDGWLVIEDKRGLYKVLNREYGELSFEKVKDLEYVQVDTDYFVTEEEKNKIEADQYRYKFVENLLVELSDEEYQAFLDKQEQARIAMLNLTRGDVFRGLLLAKGITKSQISQMIEAMPVSTEEETVKKELAKIDFEDALNFYRGNQLIDTIGLALGISKEQLDKFFETGDYTELTDQVEEETDPVSDPVEAEDEETISSN